MKANKTWSLLGLALATILLIDPTANASPVTATGTRASAPWQDGWGGWGGGYGCDDDDDGYGGGDQGSHGAPEIDPGLAAGAILLLAGGTLVLLGQRRYRASSAPTT